MKDIENIKDVNKITLSYMLLKGLFGEKIEKDNPFFTYIVDNTDEDLLKEHYVKIKKKKSDVILLNDINDINKNINPIENKLFHKMIVETHNMYFRLNEENVEMKIDSKLTEQIETYLDEENNFVDDIIYEFKYYLIDVLINFKSTNINYNNIKIEILTNEMNEAVKIDDYDNAIFFRDIINDTKKKIEKKIDK